MHIDWSAWTPLHALQGGLLIGLGISILLLVNARIAGISGIIGGVIANSLRRQPGELAWRIAFILGLFIAPWLWFAITPTRPPQALASHGLLISAGLLVGIGTRLGSGCTSGHGICGLARFSWRSILATVSFMGAGMLTVFIVRHLL